MFFVARKMADAEYRRSAEDTTFQTHIAPINRYVEALRESDPPGGRGWVPYVHSIYGGTSARVLSLMRDPGPKVHPDLGGSGFLSCENDDPSAERLSTFLDLVGCPVGSTMAWNIYPWWLNREPVAAELDAGGDALTGLLALLPDLQIIVVHGGSAHEGWERLTKRSPSLAERYQVAKTYHTSRSALRHPDPAVRDARTQHIIDTYERVTAAMQENPSALDQRSVAEGPPDVVPHRRAGRVRQWAREHGVLVNDRGPLNVDVVDAYNAAHRTTPFDGRVSIT